MPADENQWGPFWAVTAFIFLILHLVTSAYRKRYLKGLAPVSTSLGKVMDTTRLIHMLQALENKHGVLPVCMGDHEQFTPVSAPEVLKCEGFDPIKSQFGRDVDSQGLGKGSVVSLFTAPTPDYTKYDD